MYLNKTELYKICLHRKKICALHSQVVCIRKKNSIPIKILKSITYFDELSDSIN